MKRSGLVALQTISDLREEARRRLPRAVFDFMDGAAEDELTARRNQDDFRRLEFEPCMLVDVSRRELGTTILGQPARMPVIIAPTGLSALVWPQAEMALARAGQVCGIPVAVSMCASVSLEQVAEAATDGRRWFQVYVFRDRDLVRSLLKRARAAGYEALVVTVDVPVLGQRERDHRNGFTVPLRLSTRMLRELLRCPRWSYGVTRHGVPTMENFLGKDGRKKDIATLSHLMTSNMDASLTWSDLSWLRDSWQGKVVVKGILSPADALEAIKRGADAVVVSNHGGRQLDGAPSSIASLPAVVRAVSGRAEVYVDGGIRRGSDVAKALALGARAVLVGRATLYGAAVAGELGAHHALSILHAELDRCLALLGCAAVDSLSEQYIRGERRPLERAPQPVHRV